MLILCILLYYSISYITFHSLLAVFGVFVCDLGVANSGFWYIVDQLPIYLLRHHLRLAADFGILKDHCC